ncbi:MAG: hypothetical protein WC717_03480 [Candidatus Micrarchaeia archaeon]|jgi:hypothetical protein
MELKPFPKKSGIFLQMMQLKISSRFTDDLRDQENKKILRAFAALDGLKEYSPSIAHPASEKKFAGALESFKSSLKRLIGGATPQFIDYGLEDILSMKLNQARGVEIKYSVEDGTVALCEELRNALAVALHMLNEEKPNGTPYLRMHMMKNADNTQQLIYLRGKSLNLEKEIKAAVDAAVELMGGSITYNGTSVVMEVPIPLTKAKNSQSPI